MIKVKTTVNTSVNVWTGAVVNAILIAWMIACSGYNSFLYHGQTWISNVFGL